MDYIVFKPNASMRKQTISENPQNQRNQRNQQPKPKKGNNLLWVGAIALGLLGVFLVLNASFPSALEDEDNQINFIRLLGFSVLIGSGFLHMRMKMGEVLRNMAAWFGIAALIFLGYSYRGELEGVKNRVLGELVPSQGAVLDEQTISFRGSRNGHFQIQAEVNGRPVDFMLDTGATSIVLTLQDAERLGFGPESLRFTGRASTANGMIKTARVTLRRLRVGPIAFEDVPAVVNGGVLSKSLLGMSFLDRLRSYSVNNGTLTLKK